MKLSTQTVSVLKNFAGINASLLVKQGSTLSTISPRKTILAKAEIGEAFPRDFAIYDLGQFLGVLGLFQEPEIEFGNTSCTVSGGTNSVTYHYADPSLITAPPAKEVPAPSGEKLVSFGLSWQTISEVLKAASILQLPEIVIQSKGDGSKTRFGTIDTKNASSNSLFLDVDHVSDTAFSMIINVDNLKLLQCDYTISFAARQVVHFAGAANVAYFIASESASQY